METSSEVGGTRLSGLEAEFHERITNPISEARGDHACIRKIPSRKSLVDCVD